MPWHIDYLLQETAVSLHHITRLYSPQAWEKPVSRWLNAHPATRPLTPGLGASDDPGQSHLLALAESATFAREWIHFLATIFPGNEDNHGSNDVSLSAIRERDAPHKPWLLDDGE